VADSPNFIFASLLAAQASSLEVFIDTLAKALFSEAEDLAGEFLQEPQPLLGSAYPASALKLYFSSALDLHSSRKLVQRVQSFHPLNFV